MEKWYRAQFADVEEVAVERCTDKFIILPSGRKDAIDSDWKWYRRDREEAKAAMVAEYERSLAETRKIIDWEEARLAKAKAA